MKELVQGVLMCILGVAAVIASALTLGGYFGELVEKISEYVCNIIMAIIFFCAGGEKLPSEKR